VFTKLVTAWKQNDTNTVYALCSVSFDPYSEENFPNMDFQMQHQSTIHRAVLQCYPDGHFGFHPSGSRFITTIFATPDYILGKVYFYQKKDNQWIFTGRTDYYVD
jgi:hypothetical protein